MVLAVRVHNVTHGGNVIVSTSKKAEILTGGVLIDRGAARAEVTKSGKPADGLLGLSAREDGHEEASVIDLGWARQIEEVRKRDEHWTEVELVIEMWDRVARSWNNDTLMRLARYARLEAETEREIERKSR